MKKYKIIKSDHRYYCTYRATLYRKITWWRFSFWIELETVVGKDWLANGAIEEWQDMYNAELEDRSTANVF